MEPVSRRQFLQLSGIVLLSTSPLLNTFRQFEANQPELYGRALTVLPVHRDDGVVVTTLWQNTVVRIIDGDDEVYRLPDGYVARARIQPMTIQWNPSAVAPAELPFWAEVAGPVAVARQACYAEAERVTTIGHGGVMQVIEHLPDGSGGVDWYGLANDSGERLGWSQSSAWQPVTFETNRAAAGRVEINLSKQELTAFDGAESIIAAPISTSEDLQPGMYPLIKQEPGRRHAAHHGVPWQNQFEGGLRLAGIYWHNQFGEMVAGPAVQTPPFLARWLYGWLDETAILKVI
jgi:hypothetical protein